MIACSIDNGFSCLMSLLLDRNFEKITLGTMRDTGRSIVKFNQAAPFHRIVGMAFQGPRIFRSLRRFEHIFTFNFFSCNGNSFYGLSLDMSLSNDIR